MRKKINIMLIDDNKIDLFINNQFINNMEIAETIIEYSYAQDALKFLQENDSSKWPQLILCDIHMPIMTGFKFIEEYVLLPEALTKNCKIIMISSTLDESDREKALSNPIVLALLEKPINTVELKQLLVQANLISL